MKKNSKKVGSTQLRKEEESQKSYSYIFILYQTAAVMSSILFSDSNH